MVPEIEHDDPLAGAVTSTQAPEVDEILPEPDFTDQTTWLVVPFVTVAKMRRVEPGITLKPKSGWPMLIDMGFELPLEGSVLELPEEVELPFPEPEVKGGVVVGGGVVTGAFTVRDTALDTPVA